MIRIVILSLLFWLVTANSYSQYSAVQTGVKKDSILWVKGQRYSVGGKMVKKNELGTYLQQNTGAYADYRYYLKKSRQSTPFGLVMIGSFIAGATQIGSHNKLAAGLGLTSLVLGIIGYQIWRKGSPHFYKAVCTYNANL